ncbi:MAG: hypothetical protein M3N52_06680 [Actinomycetota bacterium]|nr:hypothetical protein [Actinomycetota bacterium]
MNRRTALVITGVVVLIGLLTLGGIALAQADGPWDREGPHRGWGPGHVFGPDPERVREARTDLAEDLGAELGESPERVEAAFRAVVAQRLDEAVASGSIDREQADAALAAYDEGRLRGLFHVFKRDR